jgi:cell division transport system permease protein
MAHHEEKFHRRRYQSSVATTVVSITLVLLMLGILAMVFLHARKLSDYIRENIGFIVYLKNDAPQEDIILLHKRIQSRTYVKKADYIAPDAAARELSAELGEDFIDFLGYNPLPPAIDLRVKAAWGNVDSLEAIERSLLLEPAVSKVFYQKSQVDAINRNIRRVGIVLLGFSSLLVLIAVALIHNTIRLSVYSRRFIIRTMRLVGATRGFITRPFIFRGILKGLISALLAIALLIGLIYAVMRRLPEISGFIDTELYLAVFGLVVVVGVMLSWISTWFAVRRFIRMKEDDLYR